MPEDTRSQVPHRIEEVVGHHLRFAAGAAGEVHDHRVLVVVHEGRTYKRRSLHDLGLIVAEALRDGFPVVCDGDILFHRGTLVLGSLYLADHIGIVHTNDGLDARARVPIYYVVFGQHVRGGNDDSTYLAQGQHHNPPLVAALENQHDRVALADAQRLQVGCGLVALLFQLFEGGANLFALVVGP